MQDENPIRVLRRALGMTQHRFADELGCSYSSVQGYEGGRNVPATMLDKMVVIARSRRLPDLADQLSSWTAEPKDGDPSPWGYTRKNKRLHDMLEAILLSGDQRALDAIESNLAIFYSWVAERSNSGSGAKKR